MRTMIDSTSATDALAQPADLYAGYVDGRYTNVDQLLAGGKPVVTISAIGVSSANVVDVEPGCVWPPAAAVPWVQRMRSQGQDPTVYCGRANWPSVIAAFIAAGVEQPHYWIAHYTNMAHFCDGACYNGPSVGGLVAVATQYGGDLPSHYDISIVSDYWPGVDTTAAPAGGGTLIPNVQEDDMTPEQAVALDRIDRAAQLILGLEDGSLQCAPATFTTAHKLASGTRDYAQQARDAINITSGQVLAVGELVQALTSADLPAVVGALSDADVARIATASADELSKRLAA